MSAATKLAAAVLLFDKTYPPDTTPGYGPDQPVEIPPEVWARWVELARETATSVRGFKETAAELVALVKEGGSR